MKWFEKATHHSSDEDDRNGSDVVGFESYLDSIKELGDAYLNGTGVEKNAEKANECYKQFFEKTKAYAEGGEGEVYKYRLGFCYMDGIGVEKNAAMAMQCWKDAPFHLYKVRAAYDKQANQWKAENVCRHCGGKFKGLFKKKCSNCGLEKDYKKPRKK